MAGHQRDNAILGQIQTTEMGSVSRSPGWVVNVVTSWFIFKNRLPPLPHHCPCCSYVCSGLRVERCVCKKISTVGHEFRTIAVLNLAVKKKWKSVPFLSVDFGCISVISIFSRMSGNGYYNIVDRRCKGKVVLMIAIVWTQSSKFFCTILVSPVQTVPVPTLTP